MRTSRLLLVGCLLGVVVWTSQPRAQQPASAFYGIGDLSGGGVGSAVRDATRVNGTIYAVGASTVNALPNAGGVSNLDTPALWTTNGGAGTLVALPNIANTHASHNTAYAITSGAEYVASQARVSATVGATDWVRVDLAQVPPANLNLSAAPGTPAFAALALSDDGGVVYGQNQTGTGGFPTETRLPVRYEVGGSAAVLDLSPTGRAWGVPVPRGTSGDGRFMVGIASDGHVQVTQASSPVAFRYDAQAATPVTVIPFLTDGWWNMPVALTADGSQTMVIGNSPDYPMGAVYLTDAANQIAAELGSPNTGFSPLPLGGMTADGVIGITFAGAFGPGQISGLGIPAGNKHAYIHNSHGWFHFSSVLAAEGIDLSAMGWDPGNLAITGIRTVEGMDLVFGQGRRRTPSVTGYVTGAVEGFVAELPAGVLASFQPPPPAPPANDALVGIWLSPSSPDLALAYLADGTYFQRAFDRFERGSYTLAEDGTVTITTLTDTGGAGFSGNNGRLGLSYSIVGDEATLFDAYCTGCPEPNPIVRVPMTQGSIVGGWIMGDPTQADSSQLAVLLDSASGNQYFVVNDGPGTDDGVETGTYVWTAQTGALELSDSDGESITAILSRDELGLDVHIEEADGGMYDLAFTRIVQPSTVLPAITNDTLEAIGSEDASFSFTVTAINAQSFEAAGLPNGVTIDAATGVISGTPTVNGVFNVTVTATNSLGDTTTVNLVLAFAAPPGAFYGIGDLPGGGVGSAVRDATRVNGTIYAVGASTVNASQPAQGVPNLDTPVLWSSTGGAGGTLTALPPQTAFVPTQTTSISAFAITTDATFIASQARRDEGTNVTNWVRVDQSLTNLNLSDSGTPAFAALALSDMGDVIYGMHIDAGVRLPVRYQAGVVSFPDLSPTGRTWGVPLPRGTSTDPSVDGRFMVGIASNGAIAISQASSPVAFRYDAQTTTTTVIPLLTDGWWNMPVALSADGSQTVVIGNNPDYPLGAVYLTDATNQITAELGSPNTGFSPLPLGGMTADGSVIAVTFAQGFGPGPIVGLGIPGGNKHAYIHNSHGWFLLESVLAAEGIDLSAMGWSTGNMAITGIRTVEGMDLVFGQGRRRTPSATGYTDAGVEGFVAELPAGVLASFNPPPPGPPANDALVGVWLFPGNPQLAIAYLADGTYFARTGTSFERGFYTLAEDGAYTIRTVQDTNGAGFSGNTGRLGLSFVVAGDEATQLDAYCPGCPTPAATIRVPAAPGSIVGGWITGDPTQADSSQLAVLLDDASGNEYFVVNDGPGSDDGVETGTYVWHSETGALELSASDGESITATLSRDELGLDVHLDYDPEADGGSYDIAFTRVIAPSTVLPAITNDPLTATGALLTPFSYQVTATYAQTFSALGLPPGLGIDDGTGEISGTPTELGVFPVTVMVANTFGSAAQGEVAITVTKAAQAPLSVVAPGTAVYGSTFQASTTGGSGTGVVTYQAADGCINVGDQVTMVSGTVTCSITATKAGDDTYDPVTSAAAVVGAVRAGTSTGVSSSLGSSVYGQLVTLTATVSSAAGVPGGAVIFADGGTVLGTVSVDGSGMASYATTALGAGAHTVTATYSGSGDFNGSANSTSQQVAIATTTVTLDSSPNPSSPGQLVNFVATVTGQYNGPVTGTVTFRRGSNTILGTVEVGAEGIATLSLDNLGTGSHSVTATYEGDANSTGSVSAPVTQQVVAPSAPTTTTIVSSLNPSVVGQPVTFTATVTSATPGTITGTVTFRRGQTELATAVLSGGQAMYTTAALPLGTSGMVAVYSGDAAYITSASSSLTQSVIQAGTTTSLTTSPNPSNGGQLVTLTAVVSSGVAGAGPITGTVTFRRGQTVLGTPQQVSGGQATLVISTLPAGSSSLVATYSGDATYLASTSSTVAHVVNAGTTTTTLSSDPVTSVFGQMVTFTATVVSSLGTVPTGVVEFTEGGTTHGAGALDANGVATFSISTLSLKNGKTATHNIKAKYLGDAYNSNSTSNTVAQVVTPP